ncbi:hypothetical protein GJU41_22595 [Bacillus idriensis]|uniref:Uncharacterized protein n=1 Tax=Metabacillus idriensis TaxID=324768 RepID=A0A6I2MI31_9BACI|nr:hypothetical protein [Metabacillus idriensis]MRX56736.1 hypothetical protein [Metabacillus idriensis]
MDTWKEIGNTLKYKYENLQWQQVNTPPYDMFKDMDGIKAICGNPTLPDNLGCWLDVYHWSIIKKHPLSEDIYQFITHRAAVVRNGFDKEISNFQINMEALPKIKEFPPLEALTNSIELVFNLIAF